MRWFVWSLIAISAAACASREQDHSRASASAADLSAQDDQHDAIILTREQVQLGCLPMGEGADRHVMCNHGHSLNFRSENLYSRWMALDAHGTDPITEADLMMTASEGTGSILPDPMTPILRASVGERVKIRVMSYGPDMHDFHIHGHVWKDDGVAHDVHPLMPAEVYDGAEFYAGAGSDDPTPRAGAGDWMYHCHVESHAASGMWGLFRVTEAGDHGGVDANGRYPTELPVPLGGAGQTMDVWVVAAEAPIDVTRDFDAVTSSLRPVQRLARLYVPMPDESSFRSATFASVQQTIAAQQSTWAPWVLVLRMGTTVRVHLRNIMREAPVSMHPHGVRYTIGNDGTKPENIAWPDGPEVVSTWTADTAGTWPMHDHARTIENIGRGLFSAIVVKTPEEEARLDRDYLLIFHDYDMNWMMGMADNMMPMPHPH